MEIQKVPESIPTPAETIFTPAKSPIERFVWLNHISSVILVSATATYTIGFLIVNTSLFKYGFVPYDFLQARYVSAGLLYLFSTAGLLGIVLMPIYFVTNYYSDDTKNTQINSAWVIIFVINVLNTRARWLFPKSENVPPWLEWVELLTLILAVVITALGTRIFPFPSYLSKLSAWWTNNL